jgi:hypothetical protein
MCLASAIRSDAAREKRDAMLMPEIERVWRSNLQVYGADKVWRQLQRERIAVARCTVERLMRVLGIQGVRRGKVVRTTLSNRSAPCPLDKVNRQFRADRPNQLWVSDFTYVSTWQGWLYVAFVIDVFARRIVAGASAPPCIPSSCSTRWSRRCTRASPSVAARLSITATGARNTCPSATASASPKPASNRRSAVAATATTTHWLKPSTASTKPS